MVLLLCLVVAVTVTVPQRGKRRDLVWLCRGRRGCTSGRTASCRASLTPPGGATISNSSNSPYCTSRPPYVSLYNSIWRLIVCSTVSESSSSKASSSSGSSAAARKWTFEMPPTASTSLSWVSCRDKQTHTHTHNRRGERAKREEKKERERQEKRVSRAESQQTAAHTHTTHTRHDDAHTHAPYHPTT